MAATIAGSFVAPSALNRITHATAATNTDSSRPNILLIVGDDFGYSDIGAFGSEISTHNLDALANEGKILTNYHTVPVCSPARVALLTGVDHHIGGIGSMYELIAQNQIGKPGYETWINHRVVTVAELLKDAGYHTYLSGKWHLSGNHGENGTLPFDRGFERSLTMLNGEANHFNGFPEAPLEKITFAEDGKVIPRPGNNTLFSSNLYTDKIMDYIKNDTDAKPFFAYLSFQVAHSPFQSPQEYVSKYNKLYNSLGWDKIREQRFEKQKQLGFWNADMKLPDRIPHDQPWASLSNEQQAYAARILAVRASMIQNTDDNIGRLIQMLKDIGRYDNTLIVFLSDNGTSEPAPLLGIKFTPATPSAMVNFVKGVNNTLSNLGNGTSFINYAAWGASPSASPLSGYKTTEYEAGTRVPFIVKEPRLGSSAPGAAPSPNMTNSKIIKAFAYVNDIPPTILQYAGVQSAYSSYKGMPVHQVMGKSLKALFNGTADRVYGQNETVIDEMFNNSAVYMDNWKAMNHQRPIGDGKWQLYNLISDPSESNNLADSHPELLQKMISAYNAYAKDVGVVIPRGQTFFGTASVVPPVNNQTKITITSTDITPEKFASVDGQ